MKNYNNKNLKKQTMKTKILFLAVIFLSTIGCNTTINKNQKHEITKMDSIRQDSIIKLEIAHNIDSMQINWSYTQDTDKMTSDISQFAVINSIDKVSDDSYAHLGRITIRKKEGKTEIILSLSSGIFNMRDGIDVKIKFDKNTPIDIHGDETSDGSYDVTFLENDKCTNLLNKIETSKKMMVKVEVYDEGFKTMEFNTINLKWNN